LHVRPARPGHEEKLVTVFAANVIGLHDVHHYAVVNLPGE